VDDPPAPYARKINEVMLDWIRLRGPECEALTFAFTSEQVSREPTLIGWILRLINQDIPQSTILQTLRVELVLQDDFGKELKRLIVGAAT
jgi:hypothetical protein